MKPNLTLIAIWVTALRSGLYAQCTQQLCKRQEFEGVDGYCCLGLATLLTEGADYFEARYHRSKGLPPGGVAGKYGFINGESMNWALVNAQVSSHGLTNLNDTAGLSFPKIADLLERALLPNMRHS